MELQPIPGHFHSTLLHSAKLNVFFLCTRRLEGVVISNSVGMAVIDSLKVNPNERLKKIKYYWGSGDEGIPAEIFSNPLMNKINIIGDKKKNGTGESDVSSSKKVVKFWPLSGASVVDITQDQSENSPQSGENQLIRACKVVVLGHIVMQGTSEFIESGMSPEVALSLGSQFLDFSILQSAFGVVSNPHSAPDLWIYKWHLIPEVKTLPFKDGSISYEWFGVSPGSGPIGVSDPSTNDYMYLLGVYVWRAGQTEPKSLKRNLTTLIEGTSHDIFSVATNRYNVIGRVLSSDILSGNINIEVLTEDPFNMKSSVPVWRSINGGIGKHVTPTRCFPFEGVASEGTLSFDEVLSQWVFVTLLLLDKALTICHLPVQSKWDGDIPPIENCDWECRTAPAIDRRWIDDADIVAYAGRLHPELMPPSTGRRFSPSFKRDLVISYIPNTALGPQELFSERYLNAYTPKFVSVRFDETKIK